MPTTTNLLALEIQRALGTLQVVTGNQAFTWQGLPYICVPHEETDQTMFGPGGSTPIGTLEIDVLPDILPTPGPRPDQFLTYPTDGKKWLIKIVKKFPDLSLRITCVDPDRGAGIVEREM